MFITKQLRIIFGLEGDEVPGNGDNHAARGDIICSVNFAPNDMIGKDSSVVVVYLKAR